MRTLTVFGFPPRLFFALVLVFFTDNPSGYSFYHLIYNFEESSGGLPLMGLFGILFLIGWTIYVLASICQIRWIRMTWMSNLLGAQVKLPGA